MTFGKCPAGLMCRFGDCHIDRITYRNLTRPAEEGGIIEKFEINVSSISLSISLSLYYLIVYE
jgi:hypothetical protein